MSRYHYNVKFFGIKFNLEFPFTFDQLTHTVKVSPKFLPQLEAALKYRRVVYSISPTAEGDLLNVKLFDFMRRVQGRWVKDNVLLINQRMHKRNSDDSKYVKFVTFTDVVCCDWDWPDSVHTAASISIRHLGDAVLQLQQFCLKTNARFRLYLTPGGVRAICISGRYTAEVVDKLGWHHQLGVDKLYRVFCQGRDEAYRPRKGFPLRTSGKAGRNADFIAQYLFDIGNAPIDQEVLSDVLTYHDHVIEKARAEEQPDLNQMRQLMIKQFRTIKQQQFPPRGTMLFNRY